MKDEQTTPEQPAATPTEQPAAATPAQPAPTAPSEQPAAAPQFAPQQPQGQPQVQYIVSQRSLEGIGGWLIFWIIVFVLAGIGNITSFFMGIEEGGTTPTDILNMISSPLLAIGFIASVITIALRKKLAVWLSVGTLGLTGLFGAINVIVTASQYRSTSMAATISGVLVMLVLIGAMTLYFFVSKRVKQTLTR